MKIMERTYRHKNGVIEKTRYVVGDQAVARGKRKKGNSSFRKQEQNFNSAIRRLARILNCNFDHAGGLLVGLDYSPAGLERLERKADTGTGAQGTAGASADACARQDALRAEGERQAMLWIRRVKRHIPEAQVKYVVVTSDLDGDTGELVRLHHHVVLQAPQVSWDSLRKLWKLGSVDIQQLRDQPDYSKLAAYLLRQVRRVPDAKKYRVSRGMEQPVTEEREVLRVAGEIKAPPGARVFEKRYVEGEVGQYIRYLPKKRGRKVGGHKLTAAEPE